MGATPDWYTPEEEPAAPVAAAPASPVTSSTPDWYAAEEPPAVSPEQAQDLFTRFANWRQKNFDNIDTALRTGGSVAGNILMGPEPSLNAPAAAAARTAENPAIARALDQQAKFNAGKAGPVSEYQAPAAATVNAMGAPASPAQIGQNAITKATDFLAREKATRGAALDAVEAPFLPKPVAATAPADPVTPPPPDLLLKRLSAVGNDNRMAAAGLPAAGSPSTPFASMSTSTIPLVDASPVASRVQMPSTLDILTKPSEGPTKPAVFDQIQSQLNKSGGTLPYSDAKDWRTRIGEAIDGAQGGEGTGQLKQLYKGLTADMKSHLQANGGDDAVKAFNAANEGWKDLKTTIEGHIGNLTNGTITPESVYASLAANPAQSATRLQALVDHGVLDQNDIGSIAGNWLQRAGTNAEGHYDPVQLTRAVTALQKSSPEAFNLLFRQGGRSDAFDAGMAQASRLAATQSSVAKANPLKPGNTDAIKRFARAIVTGTLAAKIPFFGSHAGELAGTLAGLGEGAAHVAPGNPLYQIPKVPFSATGYLQALAARGAAAAPAAARFAVRAGPAQYAPTTGR